MANGNGNAHGFVPWKWLNTILLGMISFFLVAMFQKATAVVTEFSETKADVRILDLKVTRIELRQSADIREIKEAISNIEKEINALQKGRK
jgi:hypothetical protein